MSTTTSPPASPPPAQSPTSLDSASEALANLRVSLDEPPAKQAVADTSPAVNGRPHSGKDYARLEAELAQARVEKEALEDKYSALVDRVTTLRKTLGDKLKQDAESLKQREEEIAQLHAESDDLRATVDTLQNELLAATEDAELSARELERIRARAHEESAAEAFVRERELRETQTELERCRMDRDEWERTALEERVRAEEAFNAMNSIRRDLELEREGRERDADELQREADKATNLQSVLEDFQSVKESEFKQIVSDYEARLIDTTQSLAEYKMRALNAELSLEDSTSSSKRTSELEAELKEKNTLIGKMRYDSVVQSEHLTEALRRLRKSSSESNVDRRLVTNVLLSFLTTPRADSKRFEMLTLLASILSWNDAEREKAGLQRQGAASALPLRSASKAHGEASTVDETESFSKMWVEFLMKEAAQGGSAPGGGGGDTMPLSAGISSSPNSPRRMHVPLGNQHRQPSMGRISIGSPGMGTFALPPQQSRTPSGAGSSRDSSPTRR